MHNIYTYMLDKLSTVSWLDFQRQVVQVVFHFFVTSSLKRI